MGISMQSVREVPVGLRTTLHPPKRWKGIEGVVEGEDEAMDAGVV
jgi:hypothetical protein